MAGSPGQPQQFNVQQGNGKILLSWALSTGATSYDVQRSQDNVTYASLTTVSGSPLATSYLDEDVILGTQYWYKVAAVNTDGTSVYTTAKSEVPSPTGEMCLSQIRLAAMQSADRVNSNFVTMPEWNSFINIALFELYDLLITTFEDYSIATPVQFVTDGNTYSYALPNGSNTFLNGFNANETITPEPFYKLMGVDLALQTSQNAYVTVNKFSFIDRNKFLYPNTSSTMYGVFNMQYRVLGSNIEFIPTPSANQSIRLWYIPRLTQLLQDTDTTYIGISGWLRYVIVRAAKYALDKEESDTTKQDAELLFLKQRIEEAAANRDAGQPDTISDTRSGQGWGRGGGWGGNGSGGGW